MLMEPIELPDTPARTVDMRAGRDPMRLAFAAILALAIAVRLYVLDAYGFFHPDEIMQYLEQAHRLAFGYGLVPWEYRYGMRSWLVPLLLAGPMKLGAALAPAGDLYLLLPRLFAAAIATMTVPAAHAIGARLGRLHALVAMAAMALWFESVVFSVHVLTEPLAFACFLGAAALLTGTERRLHTIAAGGLLALALIFRFHYAPALGLFALLSLGRSPARWRDAIIGGCLVLLASAAVDVAMGQPPFGWMIANVRLNIVAGRAAKYGTLPAIDYLGMMLLQWAPVALPMLLLMLPVARRYPALFAAALVNLAVHMAIGHKEYRFICLTTQTFVLLAAIGSAELAQRALDKHGASATIRRAACLLLIAGWAGTSLAIALARPMPPYGADYAARLRIVRTAGRDQRLCGIAARDISYWALASTYVHRRVPVYLGYSLDPARDRFDFLRGTRAYNGLVAPAASALAAQAGYHRIVCAADDPEHFCLWERPGGCDPRAAPDLELQHQMLKYDS